MRPPMKWTSIKLAVKAETSICLAIPAIHARLPEDTQVREGQV
jgi:hypothetical protein